MRRIILLALLAVALPTAALANSIDYANSGSIGTTATVSGSATAGGSLTISSVLVAITPQGGSTITGSLGTVTVTTGTLVSTGPGTFSFTGGTIAIVNNSSVSLFSSTLTGGTVTVVGGNTFVSYNLGGVVGGFQITGSGLVSGDTIVTPEPGTLGLLGTGLVGLAGIVRRKLRS